VSAEALVVARANVKRHRLEQRVQVLASCYWQGVEDHERFDLLISNPPYVDPAEPEILDPAVREHEPALALFTPPGNPAEPVRAILAGIPGHMNAGAGIFFETGVGASKAAHQLMCAAEFLTSVELREDLAGVPRYLLGRTR